MSQKNQNSITSFFKIQSKRELSPSTVSSEFKKSSKIMDSNEQSLTVPNINPLSYDSQLTIDTDYNCRDIGFYINRTLTEKEIAIVLTQIWVPQIDYKFPSKSYIVQNKTKHLKFQYSWLLKFPWLVYSAKENGAYCKICVSFSKSDGHNSQGLGALVKNKYNNWRKAIEDFKEHSNREYHKTCVCSADHFLEVQKNPSQSIISKLETGRVHQIEKNRKNIIPIIQTIILCGKQNISLRGHRDSGKITIEEADNVHLDKNEGNFREILRYRAQGDPDLKSFLESSGNIKYISPIIQNEIIESCNHIILKKIVTRVNSQKCFTILTDETADISGIEQISLCVRYLNIETKVLHEDFLQFVPTTDMTGIGLANIILNSLHAFGIDLKYMRGQGYDGASTMSGAFNGVQAVIRKSYPLALYIHCAAHVLNLSVSNSCSVQGIRNCLGTISKTRDFFIYPKRKDVLNNAIEEFKEYNITKKSLKRLCSTRWIERYHAVNDFLELFECIIKSLDLISNWADSDTSTQASNLRSSILQGEFIICLHIVAKGFGLGLPLSKQLQRINIDLVEAMSLAEDTLKEFQTLRTNVDIEFHAIFEDSKGLANTFNVDISMPRITGRQKNRVNIVTESPETYFRISVFIPYLDTFIEQLKSRFIDHKNTILDFKSLISVEQNETTFLKLAKTYTTDLSECQDSILLSEYKLWQRRLKNVETCNLPKNAMEAIILCNQEIYPNVFKLLQIFATLPVSSSSNERTFSNLKRIKTYLRNTISQVNIIYE